MKMKCIAIDDEPIALAIIAQYCERKGNIELETFTNPQSGMLRIKESHPDLVLLDIEMNGVSGVELAKQLPLDCCLIFTTAYAQYALDGFEVNAVDFLHKPFFYERFDRAVQKAEAWIKVHRMMSLPKSVERQITLKVEYKNVTIPTDNILYIEAMDNYIKLYRINKTTVLSQITIKRILEMLPSDEFIRVHRSYIVPISKVVRFTKQQVLLTDALIEIPIGRIYAEQVYARLMR